MQVNDLRLTQTKRRNPKKDPRFGDGHWGVHNGGSADVLVSGFTMTPELLHCVGSDAFGMYAVFSRGKMTNGNLELHRRVVRGLPVCVCAYSSASEHCTAPVSGALCKPLLPASPSAL